MNNSVYVVFSSTPYKIGKMIRVVTREDYNHASIALDENLTQMYSFARRYHKTPLYGGFVQESANRYCRKGNFSSVKIYKIDIDPAKYDTLKQRIIKMYCDREQYLYNHLSALTVFFRKAVPLRDAYTCVEFCVVVLHEIGINVTPGKYYSVGDLMKILEPQLIYTGQMPENGSVDEAYLSNKPLPHPVLTSAKSIFALIPRLKKEK